MSTSESFMGFVQDLSETDEVIFAGGTGYYEKDDDKDDDKKDKHKKDKHKKYYGCGCDD